MDGDTVLEFLSSRTYARGNVLDRKQEHRLGRIVQKGLAVRHLQARAMSDVEVADKLHTTVATLHQQLVNENNARMIMEKCNKALVISVALKYTGNNVELEDLIQEGCLGLRKAINKFDPSRGFKFSTYAVWWIRQTISRAIAVQARAVRVPVHIVDAAAKIRRVSHLPGFQVQPISSDLTAVYAA